MNKIFIVFEINPITNHLARWYMIAIQNLPSQESLITRSRLLNVDDDGHELCIRP